MLFIQNFLKVFSLPGIATIIPLLIATAIYRQVIYRWDTPLVTLVATICYVAAAYAAFECTFIVLCQRFGWPTWVNTAASFLCGVTVSVMMKRYTDDSRPTKPKRNRSSQYRHPDDELRDVFFR